MNKKIMYYEYYENGQIYQSAEIYNGILNGKRVWYYLSGRIKQTGNYIDGKCDGDFISYYEDGKIKSIIHYCDGTALNLKEFKVKTSNQSKTFNRQKNKNLNNKKTDVKNTETYTGKKNTLKIFTSIILLIGIILSIIYFKVSHKIEDKQVQSNKKAVETVKKVEKTVTNTSKEKITLNKELSKETTKTVVTDAMKKDNFIKLSQILQKPKYKIYNLNMGAGYKISLPGEIYTNINQAKDKSIRFSSKYNEMSVNLKKVSLKKVSFKELYGAEINNLTGKMNILNADLSKTKYYINGKKNKTGIYKYAYYNKDKSEVILIDFYYLFHIF